MNVKEHSLKKSGEERGVMTPSKLDGRLGVLNWVGFALFVCTGGTYVFIVFDDTVRLWQAYAFLSLSGLGIFCFIAVLSFAQAWVDERLGRGEDPDAVGE